MSKADRIREILTEVPRPTHEQIADRCACTRRWVGQVAAKMRPQPAETDIEARLRALEQWRKDITEHLKRYENRSNATLSGVEFEPSRRQRLRIQ
jgi:lysyl-tRNA synthetase class I